MKRKLWKGITAVMIFLLVLCMTGANVANAYEAMVNQALGIETSRVIGGETSAVYYRSAYENLNALYNAKMQLLREIADEGVVLLKNDGALPMASGSVCVLGEENFYLSTQVGGGSMPAEMKARSITLSEALAFAGYTLTAQNADLTVVVIGRAAGEGADAPAGSLALSDADKANLETAKAAGGKVVVLLSGDHPVEAMSLKTDAGISAVVRLGNAGYRGALGFADVLTGAVNPSGKLVETYAADVSHIPANANFGNFAYTNGGKIKASQAKNYVVYAEGIYTDYRYFETRYEDAVLGQGNAGAWHYEDEVIWPFGYGLSYTSFAKTLDSVTFDETAHTATAVVTVKNTGSAAGKEVVSLYAQSPYTEYDKQNKVEKSAVQLMGFEKTKLLQPGESETVRIDANLAWLASYDYMNAKGYILDAGDYYFTVGGDSHEAINNILAAKGASVPGDAALTYTWNQAALDTDTYRNSLYTGLTVTNAFENADLNHWQSDAVTYLSRSDWEGTFPETLSIEASADMIAALNDTKKYENGTWNDTASRLAVQPASYRDALTADALSTLLAREGAKNVLNLRDAEYNDPAWEEILDTLSIFEISRLVSQGRFNIQACPSVTFPAANGSDQPIGLNLPYVNLSIDPESGAKTPVPDGYTLTDTVTGKETTADSTLFADMYASEPTLGATFNKTLAYRQGDMWGEDGLYCDAAFIWAPGANLHRSPYGGRASEYLSSDPVHTALMIAELTKAAQAKGQVTVVKHFAINEQEQNRIGVGTWTNEQALRELYLRAFEGIMTKGNALGLMSSYNRIGVIGTNAEYDLLTTVLRGEWGSEAYIITDLGSPTPGLYDGNAAITAGVSVMMNNGVYDDASKAYVNQTLTPENIAADPVLLTASRNAAHRILHSFIHSNAVNGISADAQVELITPWWKPTLRAATIAFAIAAVASAVLYLYAANKKKED